MSKPERFRKKPVVIEALQYTGRNAADVLSWAAGAAKIKEEGEALLIETMEGTLRADRDDWIIRGVKGEFYPCKPDIFAATYDDE